jgi:phthiodiolone/phenolphthiodiolone dimycocerosates ketoreductase
MITSDRLTTGISVGTQPPLRRIGVTLRVARAAGFDVAWTVDHFQGFFPQAIWDKDLTFLADPSGTPHAYFDYQALMGYLARRAGRMHLGVGVTEAVRRHPVLLAQTALTIAHMTKRSPILGLGAGEAENITPYGLPFARPVARLEEAIQIVRKCFTSRGPFDFSGDFFQLSDAVLDLAPPKDHMPQIWVAAHRPRMLAITGRHADGWYPTLPYTPASYATALAAIHAAARDAGRQPDAVVPGWQALVVLGKDEASARRLLGQRALRFTALLAPSEVWSARGAEHPLGDGFGGLVDFVPQRYSRREIDAAIDRVPIDLVAQSVLWGTPDSVYGRLRDFVDAGLRHLVLGPVSALASRNDAAFSLRSSISLLRRFRRDGL